MNKKDYNFFEVEFGNKTDEGFRTGDYQAPWSIAIKADHYPTFEEAEEFCKSDLKEMGFNGVHSITLLTEYEVENFFDISKIDKWPVLRKKETKRNDNFLTGYEKERKEKDMKNKKEQLNEIAESVKELRNAWHKCFDIFTDYDGDINEIVADDYPFSKSFDECLPDVEDWTLSIVHKVNKKLNEERVVYETNYSDGYDRTFIMKCTYKGDNLISEECVGFYAGEPDDANSTEQFIGSLKAEYNWD